MPGVTITQVGASNKNNARNTADQLFIVGLAERGPASTPVTVRSIGEFTQVFGGYIADSYAYDTLKIFFDEGGRLANFVRVVGPTTSKGSVTLTGGTNTPLITLTATSPGRYSADYQVKVEASPLALNQSTPDVVNVALLHQGAPVANARNARTCAEIAAKLGVNGLVKVQLTPEANGALLPTVGSFPLSAGDDDVLHVTPQQFYKALELFPATMGPGAVAIPDLAGVEQAWHVVTEHAENNRRIALLAADRDNSDALSLQRVFSQSPVVSDSAGVFAPWIKVRSEGTTRTIPPVGYVAGVRARTIQQVGVWRVPAGSIADSKAIVELDAAYTREEGEALDEAGVSLIRKIVNTNRLYGYRSLAKDDNYHFLTARDFVNKLAYDCEALLEDFVFESIDGAGHLVTRLENALLGYLIPIANLNGLYPLLDDAGSPIDPGYVVDVGPSVNTPASLSRNELNAKVGVRISPTAAMVNLTIVKVPVQQAF